MTPTNNYNNHGFYQFSPTLFIDVLNNNGFSVQDISYVEEYGNESYIPYKMGGNITSSKLVNGRKALLYVCAKKINRTPAKLVAQQSMWQVAWGNATKFDCQRFFKFYDLDREINFVLGNSDESPYNKIYGKRILLHGAGRVCRSLIMKGTFDSKGFEVVGIADRNANEIKIENFLVRELEFFNIDNIDIIVITTTEEVAKLIKKDLVSKQYDDRIMDLDEFLYYTEMCLY